MPLPDASKNTIRRGSLREAVRDRIKAAILNGVLQPDETIRDTDIQTWLGVSRTPVRDALHDLTHQWLVSKKSHMATRVANPTAAHAVSALRAFGILLGGSTRLALPRMSASTRSELAAAIEREHGILLTSDSTIFTGLTYETFKIITDHCGSKTLRDLCTETRSGLMFHVQAGERISAEVLQSLDSHFHDARRAILENDPESAESAIKAIHRVPPSKFP